MVDESNLNQSLEAYIDDLFTDQFFLKGEKTKIDANKIRKNYLCSGVECYKYSLQEQKICKPLIKYSTGLFKTDFPGLGDPGSDC